MNDLAEVPFDDPPTEAPEINPVIAMVNHALDNETVDVRFRDVLADISRGRWRSQVEDLRIQHAAATKQATERGLTGKAFSDFVKNAIDRQKKSLPAALFSGRFSKRAAEALIKHSGLICADLDKLNERLPSIREAIEADPHTLCAFTSPTSTGLKVIFRCDPETDQLQSFLDVEHYMLAHHGLEIDGSCKDVNRMCFVSWDADLFIADSAIRIPRRPEPKKFVAPTEAKPGAQLIAGLTPGDDFDRRGDLPTLLRRHGWKDFGKYAWTRPGKESGVSATWDKVPGHFYVFTDQAAPFEPTGTYRPWHVYALLEHGGNWSQAASQLRKDGFGEPLKRQNSPISNNGTHDRQPEVYDPGYEEPQNGITASPTEDPSSKIKPFTLWAPSQFIAHQPDPSACLLGTGYLELGQWTSLIGIGGLGKTRLALWLVVCQMLGRQWCGLPTNGTPQKAVIFSTENGLRRWKEDLSKINATLNDKERAIVEANLRILAMTDDEDGDLCLGNPISVQRLKLTLGDAAPGIVVFDPFADMMDGDENKTVDIVTTLTALRAITRASCPKAAILIIHHGRTGSQNVAQAGDNFNAGNFGRGAKALYSKVRCELQLAPEDRDNPNRLVLACGKSNDTVKFTPRCLVFDDQTFKYTVDPSFDIDAWRDDVSGKRKKSLLTMAEIVEFVQEKCPVQGSETDTKTVIENFEGSGAAERTIKNHIANAIDAGYLRRGNKRWIIKLGAKPLPRQ